MGRKPNAIVMEFFQRGAKLSDCSNRYEHNCRFCAASFPKGRISAMKAHLLEECPFVSPHDRQRALDQLGHSHDKVLGLKLGGNHEEFMGDRAVSQNAAVDLSALETLAEVSRQQLGASGPDQSTTQGRKRKRSKVVLSTGANDCLFVNDGDGEHVTRHPGTDPAQQTSSNAIDAPQANQDIPVDTGMHDNAVKTAKVQTAVLRAAAIDPLLTSSHPHQLRRSLVSGEAFKKPSAQTMETQQIATSGSRPTPAGYLIDFRLEPVWGAQNVRRPFSADRKKEVSDLRKKGACVRCRMLKKPCSGGDPCDTCSKIKGSRRLWKQRCVRTRLTDELEIYDTGVFAAVAAHELKRHGVGNVPIDTARQEVTITHFAAESSSVLTIATATHRSLAEGQSMSAQGVLTAELAESTELTRLAQATEPAETVERANVNRTTEASQHADTAEPTNQTEGNGALPTSPTSYIECLDTNAKGMKESVSSYIQGCTSLVFDRATSMERPSVRLAMSISRLKSDILLDHSIHLWTATILLTDNNLRWQQCSEAGISSSRPAPDVSSTSSSKLTDTVSDVDDRSFSLISAQLDCTLADVARTTAHTLAGNMERRLLQRHLASPSRFETFLAAVILLSSVARLAAFYRMWSRSSSVSELPGMSESQEGAEAQDTTRREANKSRWWPLSEQEENSPPDFATKAEHIASIVTMLLRVRGIPPATVINQDGFVRAGRDRHAARAIPNADARPNNSVLSAASDIDIDASAFVSPQGVIDADAIAGVWLASVAVKAEELKHALETDRDDADRVELWQKRLLAGLMLPDV